MTEDEQDYMNALKHDFETMDRLLKDLCKLNNQLREHRDKLWHENVDLKKRLTEQGTK